MWKNILGDDIGFLELVDSMGDDLTVVNSARVSFAKRSDWEYERSSGEEGVTHTNLGLKEKDEKLIAYLAKHKHWSPFRHVMLQFHIKAPEMVGRQWYKHCVGADYTFKDHAWNEVSGRYVEYENEFYIPKTFRTQSKDNKQASEGEVRNQDDCHVAYAEGVRQAWSLYHRLLVKGVCKEQARGVLPVSFYTEFWWTASLQAVMNFISLRDHPHSQWEIRQYAIAMAEAVKQVVPIAGKYLLESYK